MAVAADLIDREINVHRWVANDPFFLPGSLLDNMPDFQQGIVAAISRFTPRAHRSGRPHARDRARPIADLDRAAGLLRYPGTIWIFDFRTSWAPTASSEQQYRQAVAALRSYNERLSQGQAVFETPCRQPARHARPDRRRHRLVLGRARPPDRGRPASGPISPPTTCSMRPRAASTPTICSARARGRLRQRHPRAAAGQRLDADRGELPRGRGLTTVGGRQRRARCQFMPSHLASQGFFLLRARTQLREISNILLK